MVLTEKLAYYAIELLADLVFSTIIPTSGFAAFKVVLRFYEFAKRYSLANKSI